MGLIWNQSLTTGLEWQDREHRELFDRINRLFDAMKRRAGANEIQETMRFLDEYAHRHLSNEEGVMRDFKYPGSLQHIQEHKKFVKMLEKLKAEIDAGCRSFEIAQAQNFLCEWFYNHVCKVDKSMGDFIAKRSDIAV